MWTDNNEPNHILYALRHSSGRLSLFSSQQTITDDRQGVSPSQTASFVLCLQPEVTGADTCLQTLKMFVGDKSSSGSTVKWQTAERLEGQKSGRGHPAWQQERDKGHLFKPTWRLYSCERVFTSSSLIKADRSIERKGGVLRVMWSAF